MNYYVIYHVLKGYRKHGGYTTGYQCADRYYSHKTAMRAKNKDEVVHGPLLVKKD